MEWHFSINGERQGPVDIDHLKNLVKEGKLKPTDYVWNQNMGEQWSKVCEIPVLGCPMVTDEDPAKKAEIERKIAERKLMEQKKKQQNLIYAAATVVVLVGLITFTTIWKKNAPYRLYEITSETPIGTLEALDSYFTNELQMEKKELNSLNHFVTPPAPKIIMYDKPGVDRGKHISAAGAIYLFADGEKLVGLLADYPSAGLRGPALVNSSIVSIFIKEYWVLLGGIENPGGYTQTEPIKNKIMQQFDLTDLPKGHCEILEENGMEGIWYEFGMHHSSSTVYVRLKK